MLGKNGKCPKMVKNDLFQKVNTHKRLLISDEFQTSLKKNFSSSNAAGEAKAFNEISENYAGVKYHIQHFFVDHCVSTFIM